MAAAARYVGMEHFDGTAFLQEIEWLIPLERSGSYYQGSDGHDGHDGHGDDRVMKIIQKNN